MKQSSVNTLIARFNAMFCLVLMLVCVEVSRAQNFSDDFTRETYSTDVSPWQVFVGNWVITNGVFLGGPNSLNSYGNTYVTNSLTNCTIHAKFAFATNAYGGGLGARVNTANGAHYAAWIYPENSAGGSRALKLIKFTDWDSFNQLGTTVTLPAVGTNFHTLTMVVDTNLITVYFDGNFQMSFVDSPTNYYTNGGISLDMYTFTPTAYVLSVDDVIAGPINYPPAAQRDSFTLGSSGAQVINAPGVLYNDSDPESNSLATVLVNSPTNGTLNLAGDGSFTYTLTNGFSAYDSFTYRASDGVSTSAVATVLLTLTSGGAFFSDDMSRATNPASLLPWTAHAGNWSITNGILEGGTNVIPSYGSLYTAGDWDDYAVEATVAFPTNGYGGGIAGRMNPATGHRYAAWLYPDNSDRGPNNVRIVKFQSWDAYGYNNFSNAFAVATIHLDTSVGTNWHTLKLAFKTNLLSVYHNGTWLTNVGDFDSFTNQYFKGGLAVDFFSYTNAYQLLVDNVVARPLVCNDGYVAGEEAQLTIAAPGVLTNDTGISGEVLTTVLVSDPANGVLSLSTNGSFTYTPATNFIGVDSFAYEVREGSNSLGAAIVQITVNSANDAPQFPAHPDYFVGAGSTILITNAASDPDVPANTLSYQISSAPNGMVISTNGVISWTPVLAQSPSTNIVQTIVTDDGIPPLSDTNFITVVVTNPPGVYYEFAFYEDFDGVSLPALPAGWTTSQSDGQQIWFTQNAQRDSIPNAAFSSEASTNGLNELVTPSILLPGGNFQLQFRNRYDLEDHPSNNGVAFDGGILEIKIGAGVFNDVLAAGGTFLSGGYTHVISSDFGNPLAGRSAWSGDSAGFITTILALPSAASGQTVQFRWRCATDGATGGGGWAVDNVGLTNVLCCNLFAPVLPAQNNISIAENTLVNITNTATDGDLPSDHLIYALVVAPVGASITTNGIIAWQPTEAQGPTLATFTTVVTDKAGLKATNTFDVTVTEVNVAPSFVAGPTNTSIAEGSLLTVTNSATDSDVPAQVLTYQLLGGSGNATISAAGVITWTPGENEGPGTNTLVTVVSDGVVSVTNSFTVIVTEVNVAPQLPTQTNRTVAEVTLLTVTNTASDSDMPTNTLTYSLLVAPTNAAISGGGVITWTPTEAQGPSTNVFTTVASDGTASATNSFTVVVTEVNLAPVATNDSYFLTNAVLTVAASGILANDADADLPANTLTAVLVNGPTNGVLNLSSNGGFIYTPNVGFSGLDVFMYRAMDGITTSAVATVSITVSNRSFIITSVLVNSGLATVTWNSTPGLSYRVQYLSNLNSTNWTDVNPIVTATNISASVTNFVGSSPQRFYRVKVVDTPQPVILSLQVTNGNALITWSSVASRDYRLQYKTNLTDMAWTEVTPSITATATTATTTNAVGAASQRFFRIRLMP